MRASFQQIVLAFLKKLVYTVFVPAGVMELVDVVDSKSTASDGVPVRVRPPAPTPKFLCCKDFGVLLLSGDR